MTADGAQSPLGPSPDQHQVPRPGSVRKPPAATSRASVDTLGSYDSHPLPTVAESDIVAGHDSATEREAAKRDRRRRPCEIRPSGRRDAANPRSSVSSRRLWGAHSSVVAGGHGRGGRRDYRNRGKALLHIAGARDWIVAKPIVSSKVVQTTKAIVGDWELPPFAGARRNPRKYAVRRALRAKGVRRRARPGGECNEPRGSGPGTVR